MVKVGIPIEEVMSNPNLTISSSSFAVNKVIIKRASFKKGEIPKHLEGWRFTKGICSGETGTVVYKGKKIPKVAACIAQKRKASFPIHF